MVDPDELTAVFERLLAQDGPVSGHAARLEQLQRVQAAAEAEVAARTHGVTSRARGTTVERT